MSNRRPSRPKRTSALFLLGLAPLALVACGEAESREVADQPESESTVEALRAVPVGTQMTFRVESDVSTETHATGDHFRAVLEQPVRWPDGEVALAAGTPSRWTVTESAVEDGRALLAFELTSIEVDGEWIPVHAAIQDTRLEVDDPDSSGETAAKIGIGTAAGALIGQILGKDTESTLTGAGVGAAVGTVVALSTRSGKASVPAGSAIEVELVDAIEVSGDR